MRLDTYQQGDYTPGAGLVKQLAWWFAGQPLVRSHWVPFSRVKVAVLRAFGARIGNGVRVKPGVRVKFPWRLTVGDHVWIGEDVWIDNLAPVTLGSHVCVSQGAYLCTGSHDWGRDSFDLITRPIVVEDGAWVAAFARVGPGVTVGRGAVLTLGGVAVKSLEPGMVHAGDPAGVVKARKIRN